MLNLECGWRPNRSMWSAGWPTSPADRREAKPTVRAKYLGWPQTLTNKTPRINQINIKNDDALPSVQPLSVALELKAALSQWTGVKTGEYLPLWGGLRCPRRPTAGEDFPAPLPHQSRGLESGTQKGFMFVIKCYEPVLEITQKDVQICIKQWAASWCHTADIAMTLEIILICIYFLETFAISTKRTWVILCDFEQLCCRLSPNTCFLLTFLDRCCHYRKKKNNCLANICYYYRSYTENSAHQTSKFFFLVFTRLVA